MRLLFMGTPEFAVPHLRALAASQHEILGVVTRPDRRAGRGRRLVVPPVKELALNLGLPVLQPETLSDPAFRTTVERLRPDIVCVVAYGGFLPEWLLRLPPAECINVHPSLLPRYRGAAPIQRSIMNGDAETGVTTMYMSEEMDAGDLILQEPVAIGAEDDAGTMHDRLAEVGADLLCRTLELIEAGTAPRIPQDESKVTFAPKIAPEDERIDWSKAAVVIHAQVRGLSPRPGAYTTYQGRRLKVWRTRVDATAANAPPGHVVRIADGAVSVATGDGMLELLEVQPENAKRLSALDFVNGYRVLEGDCLGGRSG